MIRNEKSDKMTEHGVSLDLLYPKEKGTTLNTKLLEPLFSCYIPNHSRDIHIFTYLVPLSFFIITTSYLSLYTSIYVIMILFKNRNI